MTLKETDSTRTKNIEFLIAYSRAQNKGSLLIPKPLKKIQNVKFDIVDLFLIKTVLLNKLFSILYFPQILE